MSHDDMPNQMLGRLMHVGQLLANVEALQTEDAHETTELHKGRSARTPRPLIEDIDHQIQFQLSSKYEQSGRRKHSD